MRAKTLLVGAILVIAGCASDNPEALKEAARKGVFPQTLSSFDAAAEYVRYLYIRGRVDRVRVSFTSYLVVFQHGSGIPVTRIAVYERKGLHWALIPESLVHVHRNPEPAISEFLSARSSGGKIVVVGEKSAQTWVLYDPSERKG